MTSSKTPAAGLNRRFVLGAAGLWLAASAAPAFGRSAAPVAETTAGKVRGVEDQGVKIFKAIPYGDDYLGGEPLHAAQAAQALGRVIRNCLDYGPQTPQGDGRPGVATPGLYPTLYGEHDGAAERGLPGPQRLDRRRWTTGSGR